MGFSSIVNTIHLNDKSNIKCIHYEKNQISTVTYEMLKKLNEIFKAKEVIFYIDKIEGEYKIDCVKFIWNKYKWINHFIFQISKWK